MRQNIILIGMPTSGKSTVGVILAKLRGMDFLDTDLLIQKKTGLRLAKIIETQGLDAFLETESAVCRSLHVENTVIATGGSVVYDPKAMAHLRALGKVIYLKVGRDTLFGRLKNAKQRGVVLREGQTLDDLFTERAALYERYADATVSEGRGSLEHTVAAVEALVSGM